MTIRTERLTLRPVSIGDENEIHEYAGDKDITMMFYLPNETFEETVDFVRRNAAEWNSEEQLDHEFVILYEGKIIGGCDADLSHSEDHSYATLGWIINKKYRNMGFASEAGKALLDFAFENLGIEKVYANCDTRNQASFKVMKNIGMTCVDDRGTRTYPKTGETSGEYTCLITREEWETGKVKTVEILGENRFETYTRTRVASRAVIIHDGKILLSHEKVSGWWLIPGGGTEEGETPEECVIREVEEETGVIVRPVERFLILHEYYEEYRYTSHYFICEVTGEGQIHLTDEEKRRGLVPEWLPLQEAIDLFSKHESYADESEEKRGSYQREYMALSEYMKYRLRHPAYGVRPRNF